LIEQEDIIPAPYMARNHWVSLRKWNALRDSQIKAAVKESYDLVKAKLPKKTQLTLK
jgi:predicted DNA-binding protein (MmcQ/YjbR family)